MECPTYSAWSPEEAEYAMQGIGNCDDRSAYLQLCADLENSTEGGNTALALVEPRHPLWQLRMMSIRTILGVGPDAGVEKKIASAARRLYAIYHPDKGGSTRCLHPLARESECFVEECRRAGPAPVFRAKSTRPS